MNHNEFIAAQKAGRLRIKVDRTKIAQVVRNEIYEHLFDDHQQPRLLNRLATLFSLLIIPCILAALILPFYGSWRMAALALALGGISLALSSNCQKSAIVQLANLDSNAFAFLRLEEIIIIEELQK